MSQEYAIINGVPVSHEQIKSTPEYTNCYATCMASFESWSRVPPVMQRDICEDTCLKAGAAGFERIKTEGNNYDAKWNEKGVVGYISIGIGIILLIITIGIAIKYSK